MKRVWIVLLCCASMRCTIDRTIPIDRFACEKGGPCPDAGVERDAVVGDDAAEVVPDAGMIFPDAAPIMDGSLPVMSCMTATPLSPLGVETGTINGDDGNDHNGVCSTPGGYDRVFYFYTPGKIATFKASTARSAALNTVLYLYRNECSYGTEVDCNDDTGDPSGTSLLQTAGLVPGAYYLVLDTANGMTTGTFTLDVSGQVAAGEICDPAQVFLGCERSYCDPAESPPRCRSPNDCADDGIDLDGDDRTPEVDCTFPPRVTCPSDVSVAIGGTVTLEGTATDNGVLLGSGWELIAAPILPYPFSYASNTKTATITVELAGDYVLRYSAADGERNAIACETTIHAATTAPLRIELYYESGVVSDLVDVDLHVKHPSAMAWFDYEFDCSEFSACQETSLPPLFDGVTLVPGRGAPGMEIVELATPLRDGRGYEVGVHYFDYADNRTTRAHVIVHCDNQVHETWGPRPLMNGDPNGLDSDFWRVVHVEMAATRGCAFTVRDDVIPRSQAESGQ